MAARFKYVFDRRVRRVTLITLSVVALAIAALWIFSSTYYLPAWFSSVTFALLALGSLSIPRNVKVTDNAIEIRCLVEMTIIPFNHIKGVERVDISDYGLLVPVFGSPGVMGYFGYWLCLADWTFVKVYASQLTELVEIEDIYEQKFLIGLNEADKLMAEVEKHL